MLYVYGSIDKNCVFEHKVLIGGIVKLVLNA